MTQVIVPEQTLLEAFKSLTPQQQQKAINFIEFLQFKANKLEVTEQEKPISALESAGDLVGCLDSGKGDLSLKKKEFKGNQSEIKVEEDPEKPISFLEAAKEFIGCVEGGPGDLATNKEYLKGIGRK